MEYANIIYTVDNGIATIKLNRPKALNALNSEINADIMSAINEVKADPSVRVLIMTGSERAFAAGADVKEMAEATPRYAREFCGLAIEINNILESLPIPTIAAVGGFAFGGGCEMTLACDFRVGGSRTTLSFPEVGLGIIPGANGCARATAIVGPAKAKQLVMLTEMVPGKQAYDLGLLNWYVEGDAELNAKAAEAKKAFKAATKAGAENLDELKAANKAAEAEAAKAEYDAIYAKAVEVAKTLMTKPGCALASAKAAINNGYDMDIKNAVEMEANLFGVVNDTNDKKEGMGAFLEKRAANLTDF